VSALDFDLICTHRLNIYEGEKMQAQARLIAYEVSKLFGSGNNEEETVDYV
jgi:hypothetical protein